MDACLHRTETEGAWQITRLLAPSAASRESTPAQGFIIPVFGGECWFTKDGIVTSRWEDRGIWQTEGAARAAAQRFYSE